MTKKESQAFGFNDNVEVSLQKGEDNVECTIERDNEEKQELDKEEPRKS